MRVVPLRRRDSVKIAREFCSMFKNLCELITNAKSAYRFEVGDNVVIVFNGKPLIIMNNYLIPTLVAIRLGGPESLPYVVVDEGAVKHILNGADVMVPGITELSSFNEGDIVAVLGPGRKTALSVGKALMSSEDIKGRRKGKAVKNLHYAGDKVWRACLEFLRKHAGANE